MKENKTTIIVIASIVTLCLCLGVVFAGFSGFYFYDKQDAAGRAPAQQATVPPSAYVTVAAPMATTIPPLPAPTATLASRPAGDSDSEELLGNLERISVLPFTYSENGEEGVAIDLVFYDGQDEVISFNGVPIEIKLEFFAFRNFLDISDISAGDKVYETTVPKDHSSTIEEMFDNYIRIPYETMAVDQNTYISFGAVRVTVDAPNGSFEDISTLVSLYPSEE